MNYRAVVYDLDGTLADTLLDIATAGNHTLAQLGLPALAVSQYRPMVGEGVRSLFQQMLPASHHDQLEHGIAIYKTYYQQHGLDHTVAYPGVLELVRELAKRGVMQTVLSNKPDAQVQRVLNHLFGHDAPRWFQLAVGQREGIALKPDPTAARQMMQTLDLTAEHWLYLGDTCVDIATAQACGMAAVGVSWGFRDRADLLACGAPTVIDHPHELLDETRWRWQGRGEP